MADADPIFVQGLVPPELRPAAAALHFHRGPRSPGVYKRLPLPWAALVVTPGAAGAWRPSRDGDWRAFPPVALHGVATRWTEAMDGPCADAEYAICLLEPWALEPLFGIPAARTFNQVVDLADARPDWASALRIKVQNGRTPGEKLSHLAAMLNALGPAPEADAQVTAFIAQARAAAGSGRVVDIVARNGWSERRFRERFRARMGVGPKRWMVVERFAASLRLLHASAWGEGAEAAPDFFDQSHEIKDFLRMAGLTPHAYRRAKRDGDRRVFAVDAAIMDSTAQAS